MAGFCAMGITEFVTDKIEACPACEEAKLIMKEASTLIQNMKRFYRPDNFVANTIHPYPMKIVSIDKAGPFYIEDGLGGYNKTYILVCIKLFTYKSHLILLL